MARAALALALALALVAGSSAKIVQIKDATNCSTVADALVALVGTLQNATKTSAIGVKATFDCAANITCPTFNNVITFVPTNLTKNQKQPKVVIDISGGSKCKSATTPKAVTVGGSWGLDFAAVDGPFDVKLTGLALTAPSGGRFSVTGKNGTKAQKVTLKDTSIAVTSVDYAASISGIESLSITGGTLKGATTSGLSTTGVTKTVSVSKTTFNANAQGVTVAAPAGKAVTKLSQLTFTGTTGNATGFDISVAYAGDKVNVNVAKVTLDGAVNTTAICVGSAINATKPVVKISGNISPAKADKKNLPPAGWPVAGLCNLAAVGKA